jgi:hypothetical protein
LIGYCSRAITVALPLSHETRNQDFLIFARTAVIANSDRNSVFAVQGLVDQGKTDLSRRSLVTVITL